MLNTVNSTTDLALIILVAVVAGTFMLIAIAFIRRWQQIRHTRYVHNLQRRYRPVLAKILAGVRSPSAVESLRELSLANLDLLLDPLFARRKLNDRQRIFLQALCAELGLIALWQKRAANGHALNGPSPAKGANEYPDRAAVRFLLRAKSIRNLGMLAHRPSGRLLTHALDDPHPDIQLVALRSLAALNAPESFHVLRDRLHAVAQGMTASPPIRSLLAAMASFNTACVPALLPSLGHSNRHVRLHTTDILRMIARREALRQHALNITAEWLTPAMVELLLTELAVDTSAEIRARAAEVLVYLPDPRARRVLHNLLVDPQWFVRLRTLLALGQSPQAAAPLRLDIRKFLRDPNWQVREAAIRALISLGQNEKNGLYEYYLNSTENTVREEIVEVIQRTGLMTALVEDYSAGVNGVNALMVEEMAKHPASTGLSGVLRKLDPERRKKFMERLLPMVQSGMTLTEETSPAAEGANSLQNALELRPRLAA